MQPKKCVTKKTTLPPIPSKIPLDYAYCIQTQKTFNEVLENNMFSQKKLHNVASGNVFSATKFNCGCIKLKFSLHFSQKMTLKQISMLFTISTDVKFQILSKNFLGSFFGYFWVILGSLGSTKKVRKSPQIQYTKLNLCELNSMGNTLKVKYKFGALQML